MATWQRACTWIFLVALIGHVGFSEPQDEAEREPEWSQRESNYQNEGRAEYIPKFLELFGELPIYWLRTHIINKYLK